MINVLHHLPEVQHFFREATHCMQSGGVISMIEPWLTPWSKPIYQNFHHEPFDDIADKWSVPSQGPLSGANGALPWILFHRDREQFELQFPKCLVPDTH